MSSLEQAFRSFLFFLSGWIFALSIVGAQTVKNILPEALISYYAVDLSTHEVLAENNSDKLMTPASLLKLVTTATAIELQGLDKTSATIFYYRGAISEGGLKGDIIIKAAADGTFGSAHFSSTNPEELLRVIKRRLNQSGIFSVDGKIIFDLSELPPPYQPAGRLIEDIGNYYGAPPMPLSWRDNTFRVILKSPNTPGQICSIVATVPTLDDLQFNCYVESASNNKDSAYIYGYSDSNVWDIRGSIPQGRDRFIIKGALPHPEKIFGQELLTCFDNNSRIELVYQYDGFPYHLAKELFFIQSPPLSEVIKEVNQQSNNLLADHLFVALNNSKTNPANRWTAAAALTKEFWRSNKIIAPILIFDGSGLSPRNKVTSRYMVEMLQYMSSSPNFNVFQNSLAISGVSGTLRYMWQQDGYRGRVVAKSGSMEGVINYAGYLTTSTNRRIAFSVMVNNYTGTSKNSKEYILTLISEWIDLF